MPEPSVSGTSRLCSSFGRATLAARGFRSAFIQSDAYPYPCVCHFCRYLRRL